MKVLLVDPPHLFLKGTGTTRQIQPLGLGYVGSNLAREHDVRLLLPDQRAYTGADPWGVLEAAIRQEAPDVVGISVLTANLPATRRLADLVKAIDPATVVIVGGIHPSLMPRETLQVIPTIDWVVVGEGEVAALELLRGLQDDGFDPRAVLGLAWREPDGTVAMSAHRDPNKDLDGLPFPLRESLVWPDDVQPAFYQALITQRGCPYRCLYCAIPRFNEQKVRHRTPDNAADEIQQMVERHGADYLFYHDPVYTMHKRRTCALCATLIERDLALPHCIQSRPENVDEDLLDAMCEANLHTIFFGIESGNPETLRKMNRRVTLDQIRRAVTMARERGVRTGGFFMLGLPWETEEQMRVTEVFAQDLDLDMLVLSSCSPFPGTELWDRVDHGILPGSIDFRIAQVNLTSMPDEQYRAIFSEVRQSVDSYNRDRVMRNLPPDVAAKLAAAPVHSD